MGIQSGAHYQANHGVTRKDGKDPIQEELKELKKTMEEMANQPRIPYERQPRKRNKYEEMQRMWVPVSRDEEGVP